MRSETPLFRRATLIAAATLPFHARAAAPLQLAYKPDTEGAVLGSLVLQTLARRGIAAADRGGLGTTAIMRRALLAGEIDAYPEYTGNGAFFFHRETDPAWKDAAAGYAVVRDADAARNRIAWLAPAPADNTWAIAVRTGFAQANRLASLDDLARHLRDGGTVKLAASAEFVESPAALPAFERAYGFALRSSQILQLAGGNTAATLRAAAESISGVNCAMAYGTDGALAALPVTVLTDPRRVQPVYAPALTIRQSALDERPGLREAVDAVFRTLTGDVLRRLNARVAVDGDDPAAVARAYLGGA